MKAKRKNNLMPALISFFLLLGISSKGIAQHTISKQDILSSWISDPTTGQVSQILLYDTVLKKRVETFLDSLHNSNIDTVGFLCKSYPGFIAIDPCQKGLYPSDVFIFWKENNRLKIQKINNVCNGRIVDQNQSTFFSYYLSEKNKIDKEVIFPVITGAEKGIDNKIGYNISYNTSATIYTILIKCQTNSKVLNFTENSFTDKRNMFYKENISTETYNWLNSVELELENIF